MSFGKARARQQQTEDEGGGIDHSLLCRMPGCSARWSVNINHGRVCSFHDDSLSRNGHPRPKTARPATHTPAGPVTIASAIPAHWQDDQERQG